MDIDWQALRDKQIAVVCRSQEECEAFLREAAKQNIPMRATWLKGVRDAAKKLLVAHRGRLWRLVRCCIWFQRVRRPGFLLAFMVGRPRPSARRFRRREGFQHPNN